MALRKINTRYYARSDPEKIHIRESKNTYIIKINNIEIGTAAFKNKQLCLNMEYTPTCIVAAKKLIDYLLLCDSVFDIVVAPHPVWVNLGFIKNKLNRNLANEYFYKLKPFPFKALWHKIPIEKCFSNLQKYKPRIIIGEKSKSLGTIITSKSDYTNMDIITDLIPAIEEQRLRARKRKLASVWSLFYYNYNFCKSVVSNSIENTRESIYYNARECNQFKPSLVVAIANIFKPKSMLDISAGWGDRLTGAMAAPSINKYTGYDPNIELKCGHSELITKFGNDNYQVIYEPFETAVINDKYDLVMSSPPFFNLEEYNNGDQSTQKYKNIKLWKDKFFHASLDNAWSALNSGGYMVIHIEDVPGIRVVDDMLAHVAKLSDSIYMKILYSKGISGRPRSMFIWQKRPK